jgi:hypothetical protein
MALDPTRKKLLHPECNGPWIQHERLVECPSVACDNQDRGGGQIPDEVMNDACREKLLAQLHGGDAVQMNGMSVSLHAHVHIYCC